MSHKDTLTLYEELVATGISDAQARIQAHQLGGVSDFLEESLNKFNYSIQDSLDRLERSVEGTNRRMDKIDTNLWWMRSIGISMATIFFANIVVVLWKL